MQASARQEQTPPPNFGNANKCMQPCVYSHQDKDDAIIDELDDQSFRDYLNDFGGVRNFHKGE